MQFSRSIFTFHVYDLFSSFLAHSSYVLTQVMNLTLSNEYSPLGLTYVMNSIFLDPSNEFLTQAVNIGIPKQTLGLCFHVSK